MVTVTESLHIPDLLGGLTLQASALGLCSIRFRAPRITDNPGVHVRAAEQQLREYFSGARFAFNLPLDLAGTPFQLEVWRTLAEIPYAATRSYRDIAQGVHRPKGFQAIGQANTRNPLPIVIPCHRVINTDGSLGGYGGGIDLKIQLLQLEQRHAQRFRETAA